MAWKTPHVLRIAQQVVAITDTTHMTIQSLCRTRTHLVTIHQNGKFTCHARTIRWITSTQRYYVPIHILIISTPVVFLVLRIAKRENQSLTQRLVRLNLKCHHHTLSDSVTINI